MLIDFTKICEIYTLLKCALDQSEEPKTLKYCVMKEMEKC